MYLDSKAKHQAGYSLVELLIGMGVMIVIVGATMAIINGSLKFSHSIFYVTDAEESLRSAHELINRDLVSAGHRSVQSIAPGAAHIAN